MKVELQHITKTFYGSKALDDVQLQIEGGKINCLVGENGAGKSTIIKILAGFHAPDSGEIRINGERVFFHSPKDSQNYKISVIHQELMLVPELTVAENIFLGSWPLKSGMVDKKEMRCRAGELLKQLGTQVSPDSRISELSTGEQQLVEIAKALSKDVELLILDEPTASLSEVDANRLLEIVKELRAKNIAVLYVSHRLEEVFQIADLVTVFRDGRYVDCLKREEVDKDQIVAMMVGRKVGHETVRHKVAEPGAVALSVKNLSGGKRFRNIDFELREGEVLGIAGLVGAGRTEILRAIYGLDRIEEGKISVYGRECHFRHPRQAIASGISLVPEDRKNQGLVLGQSIKNNITLGTLKGVSRLGWINSKKVEKLSEQYREKLSIKMESVHVPVSSLSGGNQQKVVLARSLAMEPSSLMLDEPTRGVDVGAREEIHRLIDAAVNDKMAVLIVSSDILELLDLSDRVVVLKDGEIVGRFEQNGVSKEEVIRLATA